MDFLLEMEHMQAADSNELKTVPIVPSAPARKYVSVFRVDGAPILPPLMTTEKRRQMQKLREKAVKIEQKLAEKRNKRLHFREILEEVITTPNSEHNSCDSGSASQRSSDIDEASRKEMENSYLQLSNLMKQRCNNECPQNLNKRLQFREILEEVFTTHSSEHNNCDSGSDIDEASSKEMENSYLQLSNLMKQRCNESKNKTIGDAKEAEKLFMDCSTSTLTDPKLDAQSSEMNLLERMQKLRKSETLIYDNHSNTIILPMSGLEQQQLQHEQQQLNLQLQTQALEVLNRKRNAKELRDIEEKANLNYLNPQKPLHLTLEKSNQQIPSISIDPPTPLIGNAHNICNFLSSANSVDSMDISGVSAISAISSVSVQHKESLFSDEYSSDESINCVHNTGHELKAHKKVTNITAKIIQFEHFNVEDDGTERTQQFQNTVLMPCNPNPPQRSATSPSLKPVIDRSPRSCLDVSPHSEADNPLVRSNSFTLDRPSKALIEHIMQQKNAKQQHHQQCQQQNKRFSPTRSATRDTIESRAKRVQKVELKSRPSPMRSKARSPIRHAANTASGNFASNCNALPFKNKRSPYELKCAAKSKVTHQLKKSTSSVTANRQVKTKTSLPTLGAGQTVKRNIEEIEAEHRQKFTKLLAQQRDEQRRMQQVFEEQQKVLLQHLTAEMGKVQLQQQQPASNLTLQIEGISAETSPDPKSECTEMTLKSPTLSINSSVFSTSIGGSCGAASSSHNICNDVTTVSLNSARTPRRRLFSPQSHQHPHAHDAAATMVNVVGIVGNVTTTNRRPPQQQTPHERRLAAATLINACARGFLLRRLFQTEQIQRIVQTIRDTLIFVLNLHMETAAQPEEANTAANIKLKARLLQQLSSASRTLHLVFFQTNIRERMEIIARDRKRIKTKLMAMNIKRSPRILAG